MTIATDVIQLLEAANKDGLEGTYIAYKVDQESISNIGKFAKDFFGIDINPDTIHCTMIYSPDTDMIVPASEHLPEEVEAVVSGIEIFGKDNDAIVLTLESEQLQEINSKLREIYKYQVTFPDYRPHITMKEGDDIKALNISSDSLDVTARTLPEYDLGTVKLISPYVEPIADSWDGNS